MRGTTSSSPRSFVALRSASSLTLAVGLVGFVLSAGTGSVACGTEPVGIESCQKIERVRCESAGACGIDLGRPAHSGTGAESDVAACIRYYDDQCLHGLVLTKEPETKLVDACVTAIIEGDCTIVAEPETHPACSFLKPPDAVVVDSGTTADATND